MVFTKVWNGSQRLSARLVTTKYNIDPQPLYHDCVYAILQNQSKRSYLHRSSKLVIGASLKLILVSSAVHIE